ncbi:MAG: hypothetical protein LBP79_05880 [Clostridiales bacterium]|nr:hypothetical protein [Clostridiales bacterium]
MNSIKGQKRAIIHIIASISIPISEHKREKELSKENNCILGIEERHKTDEQGSLY